MEIVLTAWGDEDSQRNLGDGWHRAIVPFGAVSAKGAQGTRAYDLGTTPRLVQDAHRELHLWQWNIWPTTVAALAEADVAARQCRQHSATAVWVNAEHDAVYGRRRKSGPLKGVRQRPREPWERRACVYLDRLKDRIPGATIWWNGLVSKRVLLPSIARRVDGAVGMCYGSIGHQVPKRMKALRKLVPGKPAGVMVHSGRLRSRGVSWIGGRPRVTGRGPEDYLYATLKRVVEDTNPDVLCFWMGGGSAVSGRYGGHRVRLGRLAHRNHRIGGGPSRPGNPSVVEMAVGLHARQGVG